MRTLVVSDLHIGARARPSVLTHQAPLNRLLEAFDGIDRLVLLGDVLDSASRRSMRVAEPVLRAIGTTLGPRREIILVPGNHDRPLVRSWLRRRGARLGLDDVVPRDASPALAQVAEWLGPAELTVRYPGVWLSDHVWATHGHYLDQHLLPESAFGLWRGLLGRSAPVEAKPRDYESSGGASLTRVPARLNAGLPRPVAGLVDDLADLARASTMPLAPRRLLHPRMAGVTSRLLSAQMRRASIPALARVVHRLGVEADWVLFGHVHRLGPLSDDPPEQWQGPEGHPCIANSGAWVYEPLLVHRATPPHPYWPGGAIVLEDGLDPVAIGLLDDLGVTDLT